ncbi:MAG TPA: hypothetical protein VJ824_09375 [Bacillota bacterium]|nr:hypothetical protein [Bacillota bacterium]
MEFKKSQTTASVFSIIMSFLASSHHWIHMSMIMLMGGSSSMIGAMSGIIWVRRVMIIVTFLSMGFSIMHLLHHGCREKKMIVMTGISVLISLGFVGYTVMRFGW